MARARARHILVATEQACDELKNQIEAGSDFASLAKEHSRCPSGKKGGDLGEFGRGQMVREFDEVVFNAEIGKVHGPVKTQFGYHLIEITNRRDQIKLDVIPDREESNLVSVFVIRVYHSEQH